MSVAGLCEICESRTVIDGCSRCGRLVCESHYDEGSGLCTECRAETGGGRPADRSPEEYPDGVEEYRY